jgi:hypothetical protein
MRTERAWRIVAVISSLVMVAGAVLSSSTTTSASTNSAKGICKCTNGDHTHQKKSITVTRVLVSGQYQPEPSPSTGFLVCTHNKGMADKVDQIVWVNAVDTNIVIHFDNASPLPHGMKGIKVKHNGSKVTPLDPQAAKRTYPYHVAFDLTKAMADSIIWKNKQAGTVDVDD